MTRDTCCCLTPAGASAIAVVGVRGPTVWQKLSPYFQAAKKQPVDSTSPVMTFGTFSDGEMGDQIVLVLQGDAQHQEIELQLHGGPGIVAWCMQFVTKLGCEQVEWPEWYADDAWKLLPQATTKKTASILLDQCQKSCSQVTSHLVSRMKQGDDRASLLAEVDELLRWESLGLHLIVPWKIMLMGAPNAGKSSLLNALVGFDRAITSSTPGTTRDLVSAIVAWEGYPLEFIDSAGLRESDDVLEAAGIAHTRQSHDQADLVLWLVDQSQSSCTLPDDIHADFIVGTKVDLPHQSNNSVDHAVSAHSGQGLKELLKSILQRLVPQQPQPGQTIPVTLAQSTELRRLRQLLVAPGVDSHTTLAIDSP